MSAKHARLLKRRLHRKILRFFAENEGSIDTPRGVSTWIEESLAAVRRALEELADAGFLKAHRTSSTVGYSCPTDPKVLTKIRAALRRS